jgi:hypothetical protein
MSITSSTGGRIVTTPDGLIHHCNTDRFITDSGKGSGVADVEIKFDFSAFPNAVVATSSTGRIIKFK